MELPEKYTVILETQNDSCEPLWLISGQPLQIHLNDVQVTEEKEESSVLLENIESVMPEQNTFSIDINDEITSQKSIILEQLENGRSSNDSPVILDDILLGEVKNPNSYSNSVEILEGSDEELDTNKINSANHAISLSSKEFENSVTTNSLKGPSLLNDAERSRLPSIGNENLSSEDVVEPTFPNKETGYSESGNSIIYIEDIGQVNSNELFGHNSLLIVNQDGTLTPITENNNTSTNTSRAVNNEENYILNKNKCTSGLKITTNRNEDCVRAVKFINENVPLSSSSSSSLLSSSLLSSSSSSSLSSSSSSLLLSSSLPVPSLNKKYDISPYNRVNSKSSGKGSGSDIESIQSTCSSGNQRQSIHSSSQVPVQIKSYGSARLPQRNKMNAFSKLGIYDQTASSFEDDDADTLRGPTQRWSLQPKSYRGAKHREQPGTRKNIRKVALGVDTDGETSGMGSSVDELVESSTESASEGPIAPPVAAFLHPRPSNASRTPQPLQPLKKRRGGLPKGRKRKPEIPGAKPPKAPITAYVLFLNERRKYYKDNKPECTFGEVTKLLGAEWSSMNDEQKVVYVNRSDQDKRRYRNELQAYRQSNDYQLLLRKKRIKNVMRRGGATTEESSDFTDEIDDDDSEELYCRICDQWFTSLHNKREHLYGKTHLQAITGEYQRERLAEEERALAAGSLRSPERSLSSRTLRPPERSLTSRPHRSPERALTMIPRSHRLSTLSPDCCSNSNSSAVTPGLRPSLADGCNCVVQSTAQLNLLMSPSQSQEEEEEHDGDKEDEEEEEGDDEEDEDESEINDDDTRRTSMTGAIEGLLSKVVEREKEIQSLKISASKSYQQHLNLASTLLNLKNREQKLKDEQQKLDEENQALKADADVLWMLPALFGVTPLDMVNITMKEDQQNLKSEENEDSGVNIIDST